MQNKLKVLMLGDIVGVPGRAIFKKYIKSLKDQHKLDFVIVNGENSADGKGITPKIMEFYKNNHVDVVTSGNHIWQKKDIIPYFASHNDLLRPANFPNGCPGTGAQVYRCETPSGTYSIGVMNIQGRVFMKELLSDPLRTADTFLTMLKSKTNIILVDFHAETTAEKLGFAYYLDGKVSAVVGTHTHIQTADNRVLPNGSAYITDLGMAGALNSMIGMKKDPIIHNMLTQMPVKFEVETEGPFVLSGVVIEIDTTSGKANSIERVYIVDKDIIIDKNSVE